MGRLTLEQAAAWCGGIVEDKYKDVSFFGANNDSRRLEPGQLFVALPGQRDGHDFIPAAFEKGAAAVLCTHSVGDYPAIIVEDTRLALGMIARGERNRINMKVVGITGSVGKSTTKEMTAAILATTFRTGKSPANHNNDLGLPMAILALPEDTEVAVLEMGMNHFGEMAYLTSIAQPDVAVIVNIGTMHIEHLGSTEGILRAKLEILEGLRKNAQVIFNGDDLLLWNARETAGMPVNYYGFNNRYCTVKGSNLQIGDGMIHFTVTGSHGAFNVELEMEGAHFASDALGAITVCLMMGVSPVNICLTLSQFRNMAGRQEIFDVNGMTIIKDCYNAGPESMTAALHVLGGRPGRRIAVLGDMLELGSSAQAEHYRIGRIAVDKADMIFAYGENSPRVISGAITGGMSEKNARSFTQREDLVKALKRAAKPGDVLLFKGSRGMHMETTLDMFLAEEETK